MRSRAWAIGAGWMVVACGPTEPARSVTAPVCACASAPAPTPAPASASAPPELNDALTAISHAALASRGAYETVASLTTEVGPRLAGSPGDARAVAWALAAMRARGLEGVRSEAVKVPHWVRGAETAEITSPYPQRLVVTALGGSVPTPAKGVQGEVVRVTSVDELAKLDDAAVKGKIVLFDGRLRRTRDGSGYGEAVFQRGRGPLAAAKKGAIGALVRSVGSDMNRLPHTGHTRTAKKKGEPEIPSAAVSAPDADLIDAELAHGKPVHVSLVLGTKRFPEVDSANVIGEVRGAEKPDEIVLLGAHLDSWDLATGALDDGAGCAIVLEAGRLIAALPKHPRRTVRVVLFASEENSLAGAEAYAKTHANEAAKHVAAVEADAGADRVLYTRFSGDPAAAEKFTAIAARLAPLGVATSPGKAFGGSDLGPLRELGVPTPDLQQDFTRYFEFHHSANDTLDKVDPAQIAQAAATFAAFALAVADSDVDFGRLPDAERKD